MIFHYKTHPMERRNVAHIANLLIEELETFEKRAEEIKNFKLEAPEIDYNPIYEALNTHKKAIESENIKLEHHISELNTKLLTHQKTIENQNKLFLSDLSDFYKVKHSRLPNEIIIALAIILMCFFVGFYSLVETYQKVERLENENQQLYEFYQNHQEK